MGHSRTSVSDHAVPSLPKGECDTVKFDHLYAPSSPRLLVILHAVIRQAARCAIARGGILVNTDEGGDRAPGVQSVRQQALPVGVCRRRRGEVLVTKDPVGMQP